MSPVQLSNPAIVISEDFGIADAQEKDLKIDMNMIKVFREELNDSFKEIYENTNSGRK